MDGIVFISKARNHVKHPAIKKCFTLAWYRSVMKILMMKMNWHWHKCVFVVNRKTKMMDASTPVGKYYLWTRRKITGNLNYNKILMAIEAVTRENAEKETFYEWCNDCGANIKELFFSFHVIANRLNAN